MELRNGTLVGQTSLRPDCARAFEEGIRLVFSRWTALVLAVENQWGGPESEAKREHLVQETLRYFLKHKEHYADELEEDLDDAILHDFNTQAEDGSPKEIADMLLAMYKECVVGNFSLIEKLRSHPVAGAGRSQQQVVDNDGTIVSDADSEDDEMEDAQPMQQDEPPKRPEPVVDEDGFTLVQSGRRRR